MSFVCITIIQNPWIRKRGKNTLYMYDFFYRVTDDCGTMYVCGFYTPGFCTKQHIREYGERGENDNQTQGAK